MIDDSVYFIVLRFQKDTHRTTHDLVYKKLNIVNIRHVF